KVFFHIVHLRLLLLFCLSGTYISSPAATETNQPSGLTVNLLSRADQVFLNGYPANVALNEAVERRENFQFTEIAQKNPFFGWVVNSDKNNTLQTAYQVLVASNLTDIQNDVGNFWD